jgi:hypothetical protein
VGRRRRPDLLGLPPCRRCLGHSQAQGLEGQRLDRGRLEEALGARVTDRSDPLSTALSCVRKLSDEGLDQLGRLMAEERERRHKHRLDTARWRGSRTFDGRGRLRNKTCLVLPGSRSPAGFTGYYLTWCGEHGYGVHPEPEAITCKACLAQGAAAEVDRLRVQGGPAA